MSKAEIRCALVDPSIDPSHPPASLRPYSQRRFDALVEKIYSDKKHKQELEQCNFGKQEFRTARLLPIILVRKIFTHAGLTFTE